MMITFTLYHRPTLTFPALRPWVTDTSQLDKKRPINHVMLASRWMITPEKALQTVNVTMQQGVRTRINPTLSR